MVKKFRTNDPFQIADGLGLKIIRDDIGDLKGYYRHFMRSRMIVINQALPEPMSHIVCAHELGHDRLHFEAAEIAAMKDLCFYENSRSEYEANLFAASLLIQDEDLMDLAEDEITISQVAGQLNLCPELVAYKLKLLYERGLQLRIPDLPRSDFLR